MARKPRVEYAGATYHVMCRGNRQEDIFRDKRDREVFLDTLGCGVWSQDLRLAHMHRGKRGQPMNFRIRFDGRFVGA